MQINILGPKEARPVSKRILIFLLAILCCFMCMSFTINNNDGTLKSENKGSIIAPTSSIGPSNTNVIHPESETEEDNFIRPSNEKEVADNPNNKASQNAILSIGHEPNTTEIAPDNSQNTIESNQITTNSIRPSIAPTSHEISPSSITPTTGNTQGENVIGSPNTKDEREVSMVNNVKVTEKKTSFELISNNYLAKRRQAKVDNTKTKSASILDLVSEKDSKRKNISESFTDYSNVISDTSTHHESINWLTWEEAMEKNAKSPRKIVVDLYTDWCTWCVKMDKSTFQDPAIIKYINDNFYAVKFNAETRNIINFKGKNFSYIQDGNRGYNLFSIYLTRGKLTFPSIVFLDEAANNPQPIKGFQSVSVMERLLQYFGENYYKTMDWSLFNQSFETVSK